MIVITTPTGQIGRQVLGNLHDSGEQLRVIAPIRHSSRPRSATTSTLSRARTANRSAPGSAIHSCAP
jgi:hypothetical protein